MKSKTTAALMFIVALSFLYSCTQKEAGDFVNQFIKGFYGDGVVVSLRDTTPPTATIRIPDLGSGITTLTTGGSGITIPVTKAMGSFYVLASADDPEGIQEVDLVGGGEIKCSNNDGASSNSNIDFNNGIASSDASSAKPGGNATNRRTTIHLFNLNEWDFCTDPSFHVTQSTINFASKGKNFSGQAAVSPYVTLLYKP